MASYLETELLIAEVQRRPVLWDFSLEEYKDKNKKMEAWAEVCCAVIEGYEEKGAVEKALIGKEINSRWKSIRDSYTKDCKKRLKEMESGSGPKSRPYVFADRLSFLRIIPRNRTSSNNYSYIQDEQVNLEAFQDCDTNPAMQRKKVFIDEKRSQFTDTTGHIEEKDEDENFFMAMLPSVRSLNEQQKLHFRLQVIMVLQNIKAGRNSQPQNPHAQSYPNNYSSVQHNQLMLSQHPPHSVTYTPVLSGIHANIESQEQEDRERMRRVEDRMAEMAARMMKLERMSNGKVDMVKGDELSGVFDRNGMKKFGTDKGIDGEEAEVYSVPMGKCESEEEETVQREKKKRKTQSNGHKNVALFLSEMNGSDSYCSSPQKSTLNLREVSEKSSSFRQVTEFKQIPLAQFVEDDNAW